MNYRLKSIGKEVSVSSPEEALAYLKAFHPDITIDEALVKKSSKVIECWRAQMIEKEKENALASGEIPHDFQIVSYHPKHTKIYRYATAVSLQHKRFWLVETGEAWMLNTDFYCDTENEFDQKWASFINDEFFKLAENQFCITPLDIEVELTTRWDEWVHADKAVFNASVFPKGWTEKEFSGRHPYYGLEKLTDDIIKHIEHKTKQVFTSIPDISFARANFLKNMVVINKLYEEREKKEAEFEAKLEKQKQLQEKIRRDRKLAEITRSRISPPQTKFFSMAAVASAVNKQRK